MKPCIGLSAYASRLSLCCASSPPSPDRTLILISEEKMNLSMIEYVSIIFDLLSYPFGKRSVTTKRKPHFLAPEAGLSAQ